MNANHARVWHGAVVCAALVLGGALPGHATTQEDSTIANVMLKHLNLIDGNVEDTGRSPACIALRGKIARHRDSVKASFDWKGVIQTPQYSSVNQTLANLKQAACGKDSTAPTCKTLRSQLQEAADKLAKTEQWDAFVRSNDFHVLRQGYAKAERQECVRAPTPHLQTDSGP